jgi:hypothetical protein
MKNAIAKPSKAARVTLDWSRMLGFDQAGRPACEGTPSARNARLASISTKVGGKPGTKAKPRT